MTTYAKYSNEPNFVGYPLWYVINNEECWCADCCNSELTGDEEVITSVNYEDPELYCCNCSAKIESAYGEESEEESDDQTEDFDDPYIKAKE